jgi:hypothetical protein
MRKILIAGAMMFGLLLAMASPAMAQGVSPNQMFGCNQSKFYDASTSGATKLVAGVAGKGIYVCGWNFLAGGTVNVSLVYGTGTNCGTGTTAITPAFQFTAQTADIDHLPVYTGITPVPTPNDLCINASAGVAVQAIVYYTQF